jgi:hypothetical protein
MSPPVESPRNFVKTRPEVEASIMRLGLNSTQVILVAAGGEWLRFVVHSQQEAQRMCTRLKVPTHEGMPEELRRRMAAYHRAPADWAAAPYPERYRGTST